MTEKTLKVCASVPNYVNIEILNEICQVKKLFDPMVKITSNKAEKMGKKQY